MILAQETAEAHMSLVEFLTSAGVGALICGVLVAIINGLFSRGGRRADAAKALIEANQEFTASVTDQYKRLLQEVVEIKKAINTLTEIVDEILPQMTGVSDEMKQKLRQANSAAKLVT